MPEFRWILLGLGVLLLIAIWWWGSRRPTQARGEPELRSSDAGGGHFDTTVVAPDLAHRPADPVRSAGFAANPIVREPSISPYEPLRISAQEPATTSHDLDLPVMVEPAVDSQVLEVDDVQMLVEADVPAGADTASLSTEDPVPTDVSAPIAATPATASAAAATTATAATNGNSGRFARVREAPAAARTDTSGRFSRVRAPDIKPDAAKAVELQKIIAVRVCAMAETVWDGTDLATAFAGSDLVHGRYGVFHRLHADGRSVFCVASLVEPGSFDPEHMPEQQFPGISLFAVLPGPLSPVQTFEEMMNAARQLAQDMSGMMQDEKGGPLSPQRSGAMREEVARFEKLLHAEGAH